MSAPRTARERVREEMTAEILAAAGERVAKEGAAALSLRSVARDLEMAPSALYRYFDGRDALLSALILHAYESLAAEAERAAVRAAAATPQPEAGSSGDTERFLVVPRAIRCWALEHPHEWGLIFGTPVPGYQAPEDTVEPYARIAAAMVRPVVEANAAGRLGADLHRRAVSNELRDAVAPVTEGLFPLTGPIRSAGQRIRARRACARAWSSFSCSRCAFETDCANASTSSHRSPASSDSSALGSCS